MYFQRIGFARFFSIVFHFFLFQFWSSSILIVFHFSRLPCWSSSILVVFHFGRLPFWSPSILVFFHLMDKEKISSKQDFLNRKVKDKMPSVQDFSCYWCCHPQDGGQTLNFVEHYPDISFLLTFYTESRFEVSFYL